MEKIILETPKSVEKAAEDLSAAVAAHGFGVLHVYDLKETLHNKGFDLPEECRVFEICNPQQAVNVLAHDMEMNLALPCRVSVYSEDGQTRIGMIRPTAILGLIGEGDALDRVAGEVEAQIVRMMEAAV